jgi:hypothetical protein
MSVARYFDLETQKILADGELVSLFTSHAVTLGSFREARLRTYLREHVGRQYQLASGFISDHGPGSARIVDRSSLQIDCLIHDPSQRAPLIAADAFVSVLPPHAAGFVEVKSTLGISRNYSTDQHTSEKFPHVTQKGAYRWSGSLVEALANIISAIKVMREAGITREEYFAGIFAYDGNELNLLQDALLSGELIKQLGIRDIDDLPDCICVLTRGWWMFSSRKWEDDDTPVDDSYDPAVTYILSSTGSNLGGEPLQVFTSLLANVLDQRAKLDHRTGGLRSLVDRKVSIQSVQINLPSPGKD